MDTIEEVLPPHSLEAEEAVIGSLLIDPDAIVEVARFLRPEMFYQAGNRWVYEAILDLNERRVPLDIVTLIEEMRKREQLDEAGGEGVMIGYLSAVPTSLNIEAYGRMVLDAADRRSIIQYAGRLAKIAYRAEDAKERTIDLIAQLMTQLRNSGLSRDESALGVAGRYLDMIDNAGTLARRLIRFHHAPLDHFFPDGGMFRGQLAGLMAASSVGKSMVACNLALRQAINGLGVAIFSLEMADYEIMHRMVQYLLNQQVSMMRYARRHDTLQIDASEQMALADCPLARYTGVSPRNLDEGVLQATAFLSALPLTIIDDTKSHSVSSIAADLTALQAQGSVDVAYIDHMLLLENTGDGELTAGVNNANFAAMKRLAARTDTLICALTQINKEHVKRESGHLRQTDMYLGGNTHCNIIIGLTTPMDPDTEKPFKRGDMTMDFVKNRGGPVGRTRVRYDHTTFTIGDGEIIGAGANGRAPAGLAI